MKLSKLGPLLKLIRFRGHSDFPAALSSRHLSNKAHSDAPRTSARLAIRSFSSFADFKENFFGPTYSQCWGRMNSIEAIYGQPLQPLQVFFALQKGTLWDNNCSTEDFQQIWKWGQRFLWHNYFKGSSLGSDSPTPQSMRAVQSKHNQNWMIFPATGALPWDTQIQSRRHLKRAKS